MVILYFNSIFSKIPWCKIDYTGDIELSWSMWKYLFPSAVDSTIPKVRWKSRKRKHWLSPSTINLIHKERKIYQSMHQQPTPTNKLKYHTTSNLVHAMTRCETKKTATDLLQSSSTVKRFWCWVHSVKHHCTCLPPLKLQDAAVTDDHSKADMLNKCFYSVFTHEDISNLKALETSSSALSSIIQSVNFTPNNVYQELVNLDISKACGLDQITPRLLKLPAEFIAKPLSQLFSQSMSSRTFPRDWTTANVVPIYKKASVA